MLSWALHSGGRRGPEESRVVAWLRLRAGRSPAGQYPPDDRCSQGRATCATLGVEVCGSERLGRGVGGLGGRWRARLFPYQVEHRLHDVPVADLSDLYESNQHCEFHPDVADRHRRVNHPRGQHHGAGAGRPPQLSHRASPAAATAAAPAASASGPDGDEPHGLRLEPRARARLLARHLPPSWGEGKSRGAASAGTVIPASAPAPRPSPRSPSIHQRRGAGPAPACASARPAPAPSRAEAVGYSQAYSRRWLRR